jgi:hypothetical protein
VLRACVDQHVEKLRIKLPVNDTAAVAAWVARRLAGSELHPTYLELELAQAQPPMEHTHTVGVAFLDPQLRRALGCVRELTLIHLPPSLTLMAAVLAHMAGCLVSVELVCREHWSQQALEGWAILPHLPHLRSVQVQHVPATDGGVFWECLADCRFLTSLNVEVTASLQLAPLTRLTSLCQLSLDCSSEAADVAAASRSSLQPLSLLTQLTSLECRVVEDAMEPLCASLAPLTRLRELQLDSHADYAIIPAMPSLTRLALLTWGVSGLQLPPSVRELELTPTNGLFPRVLPSVTTSSTPSLQRITCFDWRTGLPEPFTILLTWDDDADPPVQGPPHWLPDLAHSLGGGAIRLISSLCLTCLYQHTRLPAADSSAALRVLRRTWLPGGQATPPVMELVLERLVCPRDTLELLPAGLTHLHLQDCSLELDSLTHVVHQLPRLRVLGLDATVSAAALEELLTTAQQRDALTVHVWERSDFAFGEPPQLSAAEVAGIAGSAAASIAPEPLPQVVWHACDEDHFAALAIRA